MRKVWKRPNWLETSSNRGIWKRLTLRRYDGQVYLDRWGIAHDRFGGMFIHRMEAPDPGIDLHDHPWWFVSVVLWGGYSELRAESRRATALAAAAEEDFSKERGTYNTRQLGSIQSMRLDQCHTIIQLNRRTSWTLVIRGPRRRSWGFYLPYGYLDEDQYDEFVRAGRRDLWSDQNSRARPW